MLRLEKQLLWNSVVTCDLEFGDAFGDKPGSRNERVADVVQSPTAPLLHPAGQSDSLRDRWQGGRGGTDAAGKRVFAELRICVDEGHPQPCGENAKIEGTSRRFGGTVQCLAI